MKKMRRIKKSEILSVWVVSPPASERRLAEVNTGSREREKEALVIARPVNIFGWTALACTILFRFFLRFLVLIVLLVLCTFSLLFFAFVCTLISFFALVCTLLFSLLRLFVLLCFFSHFYWLVLFSALVLALFFYVSLFHIYYIFSLLFFLHFFIILLYVQLMH